MIHVAVKLTPFGLRKLCSLLTHDKTDQNWNIFQWKLLSPKSFSEWKKLLKIIKIAQKVPRRICLGVWILYRIANRTSCFININFILNSFLGKNGNPIVDTSYNPWSAWTPCPQTCQAANQSVVQVRNRTCVTSKEAMLPQGCFATIETRPCGVPICPGLCECFNYG